MFGSFQNRKPEILYGFFFRSDDQASCPICESHLKCIGSRHRICVCEDGEKIYILIRRLRCKNRNCRKIHHELPDLLVPYKRHASSSIEKILTSPEEPEDSDVEAESSTFKLWNHWFQRLAGYWRGSLQSIHHRLGPVTEKSITPSSKSSLQVLYSFVGSDPGWLARVVHLLVNTGYWVHTRSEWIPDPI